MVHIASLGKTSQINPLCSRQNHEENHCERDTKPLLSGHWQTITNGYSNGPPLTIGMTICNGQARNRFPVSVTVTVTHISDTLI